MEATRVPWPSQTGHDLGSKKKTKKRKRKKKNLK
jgi:hypothetical protein